MKSLLKYEFKKTFNNAKWSALTLIIFATFFLVSGYFSGQRLNWNESILTQVLTMVSFIGLGAIMLILFIAPMVSSIISYNKDLNDQHAVFESYIPQNGWKRLTAKYISYFCLVEAGIILSALIAWLTFQVIRVAAPAQVSFDIDNGILEMLRRMDKDVVGVYWEMGRMLLGQGLGILMGTFFFTFFITLHSVLRHRIKAAKGLSFLMAAATGIGLSWFSDRVFVNSPLHDVQFIGITPENVFTFILAVAAFIAVGWMLEHKTELK